MDFALTPALQALAERARRFVVHELQPLEVELERAGGRLPQEVGRELRVKAMAAGLAGGAFPAAAGGQGWSVMEQVVVHEQYGQATGGLWSFVPDAYNVLAHCDDVQRRRYLEPCLRGERSGSYAITEPNACSDARAVEATAVRDAQTGDWILNGEKWFVTGPDDTDFMIFHCHLLDG